MYRILVVDDEDIIREGIKCLFDYEALGFTICGEAATGEQAYAQITALQPDVVMMDIRMPGMSGLDVVKKVRQDGYSGKIIIVSSYTDFTYAREAMRHGVQQYITKPIDEDELSEILLRFREELDRQQQADSASRRYRQKARYSILRDVLEGEAELNAAEQADLNLCADSYRVVICDRYRHDSPDPAEGFEALMCYPNPNHSSWDRVTLHGSEVFLLKGSAAIARFEERRHGCTEELFLAMGSTAAELSGVSRSYRQAEQLKSRRFFSLRDSHAVGIEALESREDAQPFISNEHLQCYSGRLLSAIQSFNRSAMLQAVEDLQQELRGSADSEDSAKLFLAALYLQVKNQMNHLYPGESIPFSATADVIATVEKSRYLHEITGMFREQFSAIIDAIGASNRDSVLEEILHYIEHNYASNITLEDISQLFGYNRSYLGKIFSKKMGQNFNSYIDQIRIEKSKELLLSDDSKVYAIAARVGYKNVDYFHIKFKKYVGISPAEYRKQHKEPSCSPVGNTEKGPLF